MHHAAASSPSLPVPMSWSSIARICAWADMLGCCSGPSGPGPGGSGPPPRLQASLSPLPPPQTRPLQPSRPKNPRGDPGRRGTRAWKLGRPRPGGHVQRLPSSREPSSRRATISKGGAASRRGVVEGVRQLRVLPRRPAALLQPGNSPKSPSLRASCTSTSRSRA